jgi:hypothetical protein
MARRIPVRGIRLAVVADSEKLQTTLGRHPIHRSDCVVGDAWTVAQEHKYQSFLSIVNFALRDFFLAEQANFAYNRKKIVSLLDSSENCYFR